MIIAFFASILFTWSNPENIHNILQGLWTLPLERKTSFDSHQLSKSILISNSFVWRWWCYCLNLYTLLPMALRSTTGNIMYDLVGYVVLELRTYHKKHLSKLVATIKVIKLINMFSSSNRTCRFSQSVCFISTFEVVW